MAHLFLPWLGSARKGDFAMHLKGSLNLGRFCTGPKSKSMLVATRRFIFGESYACRNILIPLIDQEGPLD